MFFFQSSKPRRFHHEYMYVDERKEFLSDIEKRAKNELEQQDESKKGYREGLQRRLSHSLRPQVLTHKHNRFTAMWVSLILSAGVIALLILFLFIA
ncbi:ubiquitin carboxyl-hydrolase [Prevotella sp.]|jgi:ubiquitin carboxyl-hydrolase BAP1